MRLIKKFSKTLLSIFLFIFFTLFLFVISYETVGIIDTSITRKQIEENYEEMECSYLFSDKELIEETKLVEETLSKLPDNISKDIKENWTIVVAEMDPIGRLDETMVAGAAYSQTYIIWLASGFLDDTVYHEVGHAAAAHRATDQSEELCDLFNSFWSKENGVDEGKYSIHDTNDPIEFFAFLFEMYFCEPEDLKENFKEGYDYITNFIEEYKSSSMDWAISPFIKQYNLLTYHLNGLMENRTPEREILKNEEEVKNNSLIQLTFSPISSIPSVGLTENEKMILGHIENVINHPENYPIETYSSSSVITLKFEGLITLGTYNKLAACVDYYFGEERSDVFDINTNSSKNTSTIYIYLEKVEEMKEKKKENVEKTREVLEKMREGTETQKLLQISKYIAENCPYEIQKKTSVEDFWVKGKGDCVTYAMVFREFCEQLGIECDVIRGISHENEGHVWNRVKLSDGTYRYYDLTYYDRGMVDMEQYTQFIVLGINSY